MTGAAVSDQETVSGAADMRVVSTFETLPKLLDADRELLRAGRWLNVDCLLGPIGQPLLVSIRQGRIAEMSAMPKIMPSWRFSYTASPQAWIEYWRPEPRPGWHDLLALTKRGEAHLAGELHPFMTHLQYFKDLLALPRSVPAEMSA
ncbi:hypothetical protein [Bradyrhizobium canariense]|uniref:SCP2 domain-containing protein n=1 Tax=Bradyrhizobium canariense TaxID=255045 RepID=A0A1H1UD77_9BRAD|nr:hypothetical protein [Bradyrhizobium canariense]SDS70166.1 hypothetical protein SAMN05444158_2903 [Bradyrhizobium canariense]